MRHSGLPECRITASNGLDEYLISDLLMQGAQIDVFGVGERLITASSTPVFGGVYKLAAVEKDGCILPKIKISENTAKITNPGFKKIYRYFDKATGKALADELVMFDETINENEPHTIFDEHATWKTKTIENFVAKELQVPVFKAGKLVYELPTLKEIRDYAKEQIDTLWDEVKRFRYPHTYYVDLSQKLWETKKALLKEKRVAK